MRLLWKTTSACVTGSGMLKNRRSSKFPAAESRKSATKIITTPVGSKLGAASTSAISIVGREKTRVSQSRGDVIGGYHSHGSVWEVVSPPIVNNAMPQTRRIAQPYSSLPYVLPCMNVPKIIVGITFELFATMRVV